MTLSALAPDQRRQWAIAGGIALAAHLGVGAMAAGWVRPGEPPLPEPVVLVELPPEGAPALAPAVAAVQPQAVSQPSVTPPQPQTPPIKLPPVSAPLPRDPVALPPPAPAQPVSRAAPPSAIAAAAPLAISPTGAGTGSNTAPGTDPRARRQEADYFALISAHLNRRKTYPAEARQARQQGVVTVRFTVDRAGNVTAEAIKRSSGHAVLDRATLDLVRRVSPLPRMPGSMQREQITLSLPIDYALRTD